MSFGVRAHQALKLTCLRGRCVVEPDVVLNTRVEPWRGSVDYWMSDWEVGNIDEELAVA
jgi:hypothetical protein